MKITPILPTQKVLGKQYLGQLTYSEAGKRSFLRLSQLILYSMYTRKFCYRDVDDLSYALALYRGHNFFAFHGPVRNADLTKEKPLLCFIFKYFQAQEKGPPPLPVILALFYRLLARSRDLCC